MRQKIKSTSGASLVLALLFFLLCAMAGSVILAAGTASGGRIAGLQKNEQSYYSVTSAAKLLRDEIEGEVYSRNTYKDDNTELDAEVKTAAGLVDYNQQPVGDLSDLLQNNADLVYAEAQEAEEGFTIKSSDSVFSNVTATFSMDSNYNIQITLTDGTTSCTLTIPAAISQNKVEYDVIGTDGKTYKCKTTTLTWTKGTISK